MNLSSKLTDAMDRQAIEELSGPRYSREVKQRQRRARRVCREVEQHLRQALRQPKKSK